MMLAYRIVRLMPNNFYGCFRHEQKRRRMDIAQEMLTTLKDDPDLLKKFITGHELWVHGCDIETKAESSQWKCPEETRSKKAFQVWSNMKVLLTVFFDSNDVVHHKFLTQGRRVNKETTFKLCSDCAKQFVRHAQNCEKTNHEFYTMITHQLTHRCLCIKS